MENKNEKLLPKMLPGTVHHQYVRCGKRNCRCAKGDLHGAYYYHFVRIEGKLRKRYLKSDEVQLFQEACFNRQEEEKAERERFANLNQELREIAAQFRNFDNQLNLRKVSRK